MADERCMHDLTASQCWTCKPRPPGVPHSGAAEFLVVGKQAHYLFTVKANQPTLLARCVRLAWHRVPVLDARATAGMAGSSCALSKPSPSTASGSRTPRRSSRSPAKSATCAPGGDEP
jgi:hypothetical protein